MSVGIFLGIKPSFVPEFSYLADAFIDQINIELKRRGLPAYSEPTSIPDVYVSGKFGRSSLDHCGAGDLAGLVEYCEAADSCQDLEVLAANPYRVTFLPIDVESPIITAYTEIICGERVRICVGSVPVLEKELQAVASRLDIPLQEGVLGDETARRIDDYESLGDDDERNPAERISWLLMYEGCRLALENGVALSLAG